MAEPAIKDGTEHFGVVTWTGNNSSPRAITGVGHQPDFIWIKDRVATNNHVLVDTNRGLSELLYSNTTVAGVTSATQVSSSNTDGFTLGATTYVNESGSSNTYVAWNWKGNGGTNTSITTGTIDTVVQANTTAGFSIVKYTGIGTSGAAYHGLSKAPEAIWIKDRDNSTNWRCWHTGFGNITTYQKLNSDDGYGSASMWGTPTADAFIIGGAGNEVNESSTDYVAYCWHSVDGFSKFGKYVGNGSASDGPFIYTGFKPALVIIKGYTIGTSWYMFDNKRNPFNPSGKRLVADGTYADDAGTTEALDFLSNGFKLRNTSSGTNGAYTYMFYAWAEHPFVGDGVNPVTAR